MLDRMLPLFRRYYSPRQQLSLDEGMIPTKNRLAIKQYIHDKPVRWASRACCCARPRRGTFSMQKSTRAGSGTTTGPSSDQPAVSSSLLWRMRRSPTRTTCCSWIVFTTLSLFYMLKNKLGVLAAGTVLPSRKHYPKELGRRLTERGRYDFRCLRCLCTIAWKDRKPIHFLSNYHNPTILHECSAHGYSNFASCFRYMGTVDKNDQIACLNKMRRHYRWPRRLFMKFFVWPDYNAYISMDSYRPHSRACHCFLTFHMFVDELCLQLVSDYCTAVHHREAGAQQSDLLLLQGVGHHHFERSPGATGNNLCVVCCTNKYNKYLKKHPATSYGNMPHRRRKTHSGVRHATSASVSVSAAHAGVTITLKFTFGV